MPNETGGLGYLLQVTTLQGQCAALGSSIMSEMGYESKLR